MVPLGGHEMGAVIPTPRLPCLAGIAARSRPFRPDPGPSFYAAADSAALLTITEALAAASCNVLEDRWL